VLPAARAGFFELVAPIFDRCVTVVQPSTVRGAPLQEAVCANADTQLWAPTLLGGDAVQWRNPAG
jgi:hypothetical protein